MPRLTRKTTVTAAQEALDQEQARLEATRTALTAATGRRTALAEDADAYVRNEDEIRRLEAEVSRLGIVIADRAGKVLAAKREAEHDACEAAGRALAKLYREHEAVSRDQTAAVATVLEQKQRLVASRARVREAEQKFAALVPSDVDELVYPAGGDEAGWPELGDLVDFLTAGPMQPKAMLAAGREAAERERRNAAARAFESNVRMVLDRGTDAWEGGLKAMPAERVEAVVAEAEDRVGAHTRAEVEALKPTLASDQVPAEIMARNAARRRQAIGQLRERLASREAGQLVEA